MSGHNHDSDHRLLEPETIKSVLPAVVQIVALKKGLFGNASSAWTGSGTIVDPRGIILTNCHVANPRAMGMPAPAANQLAVSITARSDEPPALTYLAEIVVQSPELDLAVLKIVSEMNGKKVRGLKLPYVPVGNSDDLELADTLAIFGYPGIGGATVTFTSGGVAGFSNSKKYNIRRAWVKTDATIAGGNSGGTAINTRGELVGIPTQAAAGDNISPVDARPVVDTNRDGRVDQRDSVMAIGGFINGLRPINLAKPLLKKAGVRVTGAGSRGKVPMQQAQPRQTASSGSTTVAGPQFNNLIFSSRINRQRRPINPSAVLPAGSKNLNITFDYTGMRKGTKWGQVWTHNGKTILNRDDKWAWPSKGWQTLSISNKRGLPDGEYRVVMTVRGQIVAQGGVHVGRNTNDTDTQVSGQVVDAKRRRAVKDALVIALKPNVKVSDFIKVKNKKMAYTSARTDRNGNFSFAEQLPKGQAYGLVVIARGYKDLVVEGGLRISDTAPENAKMNPIPLQPE